MKNALAFYFMSVFCMGMGFSQNGHAEAGKLLAQFPETAYFITKDKTSGLMYASTNNAILVIDPNTLSLDKMNYQGLFRGMDLSDDGKTLYVAQSLNQNMLVIDTASRQLKESIELPEAAYDLKYAKSGHLYITIDDFYSAGFWQFNLKTRHISKINDWINGRHVIQISPDNKSLYLGEVNTTYGVLFKYTIDENNTLERVYKSVYGALGGGVNLHLSDNGDYIYYLTMGGATWFDIARIRTNDMSVDGQLMLGEGQHPEAMTTSPDGKRAYTYSGAQYIDVWDMETLTKLCQYPVNHTPLDSITQLTTDSSGKKLIAAFRNSLEIYETGCPDSQQNSCNPLTPSTCSTKV